jgi:hypothetical protein
MQINIKPHASFAMNRRGITESEVLSALNHPDQVLEGVKNRLIYQKKYFDRAENKYYLLRIIVVKTGDTKDVITVYKTSKIDRYWRK